MSKRARLLAAAPLAAALLIGPGLAVHTQEIGDVGETGMAPGQGRARLFSTSEKLGMCLMSASALLLAMAWHYTGRHTRSRW